MSSPPPPSPRNSFSTHRSSSSYSRTHPQRSPRRRPLHERSDSEKNAKSVYKQTPFPTLPSQVFSPKHELYIASDTASSSYDEYPVIPPKSPKRLLSSSGSARSKASSVENGSTEIPPSPSLPTLYSDRFSASVSESLASTGSHGTARPNLRRRTSASTTRSVEASTTAVNVPGASDKTEPQHSKGDVVNTESESPASQDSFATRIMAQQRSANEDAPMLRHKGVERLRSQSSVASRSQPRSAQTPRTDSSSQRSGDRPRSSSSPSSPTDAFIQALIKSGTNIQYPALRQPSATSLRSENPSVRAALPPPLRLQRKRANSQLARTAGIVTAPDSSPPTENSEASFQESSLRLAPSQSSLMTYDSEEIIHELPESPYLPTSPNWVAEGQDTVADLHPQRGQLRAQQSGYYYPARHPTEQASRESLRSSVGSFYHFLNDSRTAWAREYYRGDGRIRLESPPSIENIVPGAQYDTPLSRSPRQDHEFSESPSGQSFSPGSAGFPDRIYVPRIRPLVGNNDSSSGTESGSRRATTVSTEDDMRISVISPDPSIPSHIRETLASPVFNPTPAVPYLSPTKREGPGLPYWRAAPYDDESGPFESSNVQLLLFCIGFLVPPIWWIAAFLPLPASPEWRVSSRIDPEYKEYSYGLFDSAEVQRYRAAQWWRKVNRYMAVAGVVIVAAIVTCAVVATT